MALEVGKIKGIIAVEDGAIAPLPIMADSSNQCIEKVVVYQEKTIPLINVNRLMMAG